MENDSKVIKVTDETFESLKEKHDIFVLDCWASWCMPCRMISPMVKRLAEEHVGKITFGEMNVDQNTTIPKKYEVMSIPTLLIFKNNKLIDRIIGAMPYDVLNEKIKGFLK